MKSDCECIVCTELRHLSGLASLAALSTTDLLKLAASLSADVRLILIAQERVRKGTAEPHEEELVQQAARRCTGGTIRKPAAPVLH